MTRSESKRLRTSVAAWAGALAGPADGRRGRGLGGLLASAPGLLTGFTCCGPAAVLALGSLAAGFTVAVIAVRPDFLPAAALALAANLFWGVRRLRCELAVAGAEGQAD